MSVDPAPASPTADADLDRAIARVQKLLSKTKDGVGTTAEEAELAARLAQELMAKYNLDMAAVEAASPEARDRVERIKTEVESKTRYQWQRNLARWVAMANFCAYALHQTEAWVPSPTGRIRRVVFTDDGDFTYDDDGYVVRESGDYRKRTTHVFVGRRANVITAQLMFDYLVDAVERSLPEALQGPQRQSRQAFSWLEGCADQVCDRLLTRRQDLIEQHDAEQRAAAAAARAAWEAQQAVAAPPKGLPAHKPTEIKQAYDAAAAGARQGYSTAPTAVPPEAPPPADADDDWTPGDGIAEPAEAPPEFGLVLASVYDEAEQDANYEVMHDLEPGTLARCRREREEAARAAAAAAAAAEIDAADAPIRAETDRQRAARERRERVDAERRRAKVRREAERDAASAARYWAKRDPRLYTAGADKGKTIGLDPQVKASNAKQLKGS